MLLAIFAEAMKFQKTIDDLKLALDIKTSSAWELKKLVESSQGHLVVTFKTKKSSMTFREYVDLQERLDIKVSGRYSITIVINSKTKTGIKSILERRF